MRQRAAGLREFGQRGVETCLGAAARANQGPEADVDLAQRDRRAGGLGAQGRVELGMGSLVALGRSQGVKAVERLRPGTCRVVAERAEAGPKQAIEGGLGRAAALGGRAELVGQACQEAAQRRIGRREFCGLARGAIRIGAGRQRKGIELARPGGDHALGLALADLRGDFVAPDAVLLQTPYFAAGVAEHPVCLVRELIEGRLERRHELAPPVAGT